MPCALEGSVCNSSSRCYFQRELRPSGVIEETYNCVPISGVTDRFCALRTSNVFRICCNDRNLCNQNLTLPPFPFEMETATTVSEIASSSPLPSGKRFRKREGRRGRGEEKGRRRGRGKRVRSLFFLTFPPSTSCDYG